jgi:hypothetical protein
MCSGFSRECTLSADYLMSTSGWDSYKEAKAFTFIGYALLELPVQKLLNRSFTTCSVG